MAPVIKLKKREFRIFPASDLLDLPPIDYLVDGVLEQNSFSVLYGPSGYGKTFIAFDLALHVATGRPWYDRPVKHGYVIYVAAEGYRVLANRLRAWCKLYKCEPPKELLIAVEPVSLSGGWSTLEEFLIEAVGAAEMERVLYNEDGDVEGHESIPLQLVIFDTFQRCTTGIDENSAQDMGKVIKWLDTLRDKGVTGLETSVMVVHHSGKQGPIERGSTVLRGAADTMLAVSRDEYGPIVRCTKQKASAPFEPLDFSLINLDDHEPVVVPRDKVEFLTAEPPSPRPLRVGPTQLKALQLIAERAGPDGLVMKDLSALLEADMPQTVRVKSALVRYGFIAPEPFTKGFKITKTGLRYLQEAGQVATELTVIRGDG